MFDNIFQKYITAKNIIFFLISILFLIFITKIKDVAILFFAAYVIACSLNPAVDKLSKKMKRSLASALVLLLVLLITAGFFTPIVILGGHEIKSFIEHVPAYADNLKTLFESTPLVKLTQASQLNLADVLSSISDVTSNFVNKSISASINIAAALIYLILGTLITYYFMSDKDTIKDSYIKLFPEQMKEKAKDIIETISRKIGGYILAQIATISSVGIIMTIGLLVCGIEYALLLGLITAVLDIIPVVGPAIALLICLLTTFKAGGISMLLVLLVFAIAQIAENNLIRPYIFGKILDLHPLIIYFFILITAQYLGIVGVIFAPAIAATVCVLIEELYIKSIN